MNFKGDNALADQRQSHHFAVAEPIQKIFLQKFIVFSSSSIIFDLFLAGEKNEGLNWIIIFSKPNINNLSSMSYIYQNTLKYSPISRKTSVKLIKVSTDNI